MRPVQMRLLHVDDLALDEVGRACPSTGQRMGSDGGAGPHLLSQEGRLCPPEAQRWEGGLCVICFLLPGTSPAPSQSSVRTLEFRIKELGAKDRTTLGAPLGRLWRLRGPGCEVWAPSKGG